MGFQPALPPLASTIPSVASLLGQPGIGWLAAFGRDVPNEVLFGKVADVYIGA